MTAYKLGSGAIEGVEGPIVLVGDRVHPLSQVLGNEAPASLLEVFSDWQSMDALIEGKASSILATGVPQEQVEFRSPIANPRKVICVGTNYRDHLVEMQVSTPPAFPYSFLRPPTSLAGHRENIRLPKGAQIIDWEAELGVVIGHTIGPGNAIDPLDAVAGYTVVNDVSARDWIASRPAVGIDWVMQKAWDRFQPTGPWITPARFVTEPQKLRIELTVNGVVKQESNTGQMIFGVREIIDHLASIMTLEPGDIIATGTPAGVGFGRKPPESIRSGDNIRVTIGDLGALENQFI